MKLSLSLILLIIALFATLVSSEHRRRRFQRHQRRKDYRKIRHAADCSPHEEFTTCGPEPHCEISCDNLFSPPRCQADFSNPRCYYPRCVCKDGYVRDSDGRRCVAEWRCIQSEKTKHHHQHISPAAQKLLGYNKDSNKKHFVFSNSKTNNFW